MSKKNRVSQISASLIYLIGGIAFFLSIVLPLFERKRDGQSLPVSIDIFTIFSSVLYLGSSISGLINVARDNKNPVMAPSLMFVSGSGFLAIEGLYRLFQAPQKQQTMINFTGCGFFLAGGGMAFDQALRAYNSKDKTPKKPTIIESVTPLVSAVGSVFFCTDAFLRNDNAALISILDQITGIAYLAANGLTFTRLICCQDDNDEEESELQAVLAL